MDRILEILKEKYKEIKGFDDLNSGERETLLGWMRVLEKQEVKSSDILNFIVKMRQSVDNELATHNLSKEQDLFLKARLKNLILLEGFMTGPDQAKKALESYISRLKK